MSLSVDADSQSSRSKMKQLGYAGLLPFFLLALATHVTGNDVARLALASLQHYAAIILTFVGAVHWGRALAMPEHSVAEHKRLYWAITPSLIGWIALSLPPHTALPVLIAAFLLCWWVDRTIYLGQSFGSWYMSMRTHLTLGVIAGLIAGWLSV